MGKSSKVFKCKLSLVFVLVFSLPVTAFCQDFDTLIYYNEDCPLDYIIVIGSVSNLGVRFSPDTNWSQYNIIEIGFLTPEAYPYWMNFEISAADGEDEFPGSVLNNYPVIFNDTTAQHPHWYSVDVSSYESMQNLLGDFWVTGSANFLTHFSTDTSASGHTFAYKIQAVPCAPCWVGPVSDITLRAVIVKSDSNLATITDSPSLMKESLIQLDNYPNPFNPITTIEYHLPYETPVKITIYNLAGQAVSVLVNQVRPAGIHKLNFDASTMASGLYFYRIEIHNPDAIGAAGFANTRKMILLK